MLKAFHSVETIKNEYRRIDGQWLKTHYHLLLWMVALIPLVELGMFFVLRDLDAVRTTTCLYFIKYLLLPFVVDVVVAVAAASVMRSHMQDEWKVYAISMLLALMILWIYTVHAIFPSLFVIFTIPMMLTVTYGDQQLTAMVCTLCLVGKIVSDLFIFWDPDRPSVFTNGDTAIDFSLSIFLLLLFYGVCRILITTEQAKHSVSLDLEHDRQRLQEESLTDALTQVWNRQALREAFDQVEIEEAPHQFFLAMLDLDDFKYLNDTFGHNQGDEYLREMGNCLRELASDHVTPFRFGGDEFCILFHQHQPELVRQVCQQLQEEFSKSQVKLNCQPVSVSIGVAEFRPGEKPTQLLERADQALYHAKLEVDKGGIYFK